MSEIDPATNLPAVRENERWLVREEQTYGDTYFSYPHNTGHLELVLQRSETVTEVRAAKVSWWRRTTQPTTARKEWSAVPGSSAERLKGNHPIAVLSAAHRILKQRDQWEAREALKGAYPPKSLDAS